MSAASQNVENEVKAENGLRAFKWLLAVVLIGSAIVGNSYFSDVALLYRVLAVVASIGVGLWVLSTTLEGKAFIGMLKEARVEVRKVVWPTRQETLQTTFGVVFIVLIVALLLWLLDTGLGWVISKMIG